MTPEQRNEILRLAAAWASASFQRGIDRGQTPELSDADRAAADAFCDYMGGIK